MALEGGGILIAMDRLRAIVRNGRLILDVPTELPEGTSIELAVVQDGNHDDDALLEELEASSNDEAAGNLVDFDAVVARLGTKPKAVPERLASPEGQARLAASAAGAREGANAILESTAVDPVFLHKRVTP